jgi:hypothetical protein
MLAGIIACILAVLGILFLGFIFVPIALVVAIIGAVLAIKGRAAASIGVNILALVLVVVGFATSPVLLALIGGGKLASEYASSDREDARAAGIRADIGAVLQAVPAWYHGQREISIVNAVSLNADIWKQSSGRAEYIYSDDAKGQIILKIVLLTPQMKQTVRTPSKQLLAKKQ